MLLNTIEIKALRNIAKASINCHPVLNIFVGPNASGKTSILESIYLLGRGRSFRSNKNIIREQDDTLVVVAQLDDKHLKHIGVQISPSGFKAKYNGKIINKSSELATLMPLLMISPDADKLIQGKPSQRRRFLDWGLFHVEQSYFPVWQKFYRALLQRNSLLKQKNLKELPYWNQQLIEYGERVHQYRFKYISELKGIFEDFVSQLISNETLSINYKKGWLKELQYDEALSISKEKDISLGYTRQGPQRADLLVQRENKNANAFLSGGQQKLAACALILAQAKLVNQRLSKKGVLLVDDLPAELDQEHRKILLDLLLELDSQIFLTTTDIELLKLHDKNTHSVFHVEHGKIHPNVNDVTS